MKIVVDRHRCMGMGVCESVAPDVFEVQEDGQVTLLAESVPPESISVVESAVEGCPTEALGLDR